MAAYRIDPRIDVATTLPGTYYADAAEWEAAKERVFGRTWHWLGDLRDLGDPVSLSPRTLLRGTLDEPLLLARDRAGTLRCMSNVCTHRGNVLVREACKADSIRCGYHSRRFDLAGRMTFMPDFELAKNFPTAADDLPLVPFGTWAGHGFASIEPVAPLRDFIGDVADGVESMSVETWEPAPQRARDFVIAAHWALYVENYLEGLHIPFVHRSLDDAIDRGSYATTLYRYAVLQVAHAREGEAAFDDRRRDAAGRHVAAYYWWVFPNLMLNFYPWGLSVNHVVPEAIDRTRVLFRSYVANASLLETGAGSALDTVEAEDEAIVEAVQRGVRSRFYRAGRYSPTKERGVHHFHRLLADFAGDASLRDG